MIILITGASHTGKTLLAQKMLERFKYPYISIDHIKMGLIRSGITSLTPYDDAKLTEYLWPIVREIIKTAIENKQNLIIEGCYVPFNWRNDFDNKYIGLIKFICLAMSEEYINNNFELIKKHASVIEKRLDDSNYTIDTFKNDNKSVINGFTSAKENICLIKSDYDQDLETYITSLM